MCFSETLIHTTRLYALTTQTNRKTSDYWKYHI